ncbi:MAG TPA: hypothetical protein EYM38_08055 [Dehalococcoidia bacterium]|nr:hypothetical protein [Dehalococcoidia bacterium]
MSTDTASEPDWSPTFYRTSNQRIARTEFTYSWTHIIVKFEEKVTHGLDCTLPFFNFATTHVLIVTKQQRRGR